MNQVPRRPQRRPSMPSYPYHFPTSKTVDSKRDDNLECPCASSCLLRVETQKYGLLIALAPRHFDNPRFIPNKLLQSKKTSCSQLNFPLQIYIISRGDQSRPICHCTFVRCDESWIDPSKSHNLPSFWTPKRLDPSLHWDPHVLVLVPRT